MAETTVDIIGKGFKYEERTEVTYLEEQFTGTIAAFAGVANWGPIDTVTKVIKDFKAAFGTEINRDASAKDYSGMVAKKHLAVSPLCLFTRISDGTDQKASKLMMKLATAGIITGMELVQGKYFKVTDACNIYKTKINDGTDVEVTLSLTPRATAITSSALPTSLSDAAAVNYAVGDYFELYVDGVLYQYIISSASDILCKMVGTGKLDDASYGGKAGENVINYVDRLIYAIKLNVLSGDSTQLLRKVGTNQISVNSQERGTSSTIKINNFSVVFPTASSSSPLVSSAANSSSDSIISEINTAISTDGLAYISTAKKFETKTLLTGAGANILIYPVTAIDLNTYFTNNELAGAGSFDTDPSASWTALTNGLKANLDFAIGETTTLPAGTAGEAATSGYQEFGMTGVVGGNNTPLADGSYKFFIAVDGAAAVEKTITVSGGPITYTALLALIDAVLTGAASSIESGDIRITSSSSGASSAIALTAGSTNDLFTALSTTPDAAVAGEAATSGYAEIVFPTAIVGTDKCKISAGAYIVSLNIDGGGAANSTITVVGNENWDQFAALLGAISGVSAAVTGGNIRITSDTTGASSSIVIAEGTGVTGTVTLTYDGVNDNVDIATTGSTAAGHSLSQRFTVASANAFAKHEMYFVPSGTYTSGVIKFVIYKGQTLLYSKIVTAADITAGYVRVYFYAREAGSDYKAMFKADVLATATTLTIDNLYVGPERVTRSNDLLDFLGIKDNDGAYDLTYDAVLRPENKISGEDAVMDMGTFRAYYTGSDGNNISIVKTTSSGIETMTIMNDTDVLAKFVNFSYTVANSNFFGTLINNDSRVNKYVNYELPAVPPTVISDILDGTYTLSGGTSGIDGVTDAQYASALEAYKNQDLYDVDIVNVCGNSTKTVFEKIQEVCEYRKDCFGVVDPPEVVAGKPGGVATGGADAMIYWHNGLMPDVLNMKLDSKYLVTYFPWVLVSTESETNTEQWHAPSMAAVPRISYIDVVAGNKVTPPAGKKATITDINDIAYYLTEEEKGRIYDDQIGNNINPIVYTSRQGFFIDGQKTTQRELNAYNRINTMRTSLFMKRKLMGIVPDYYYLPINNNTRKDFISVIEKDIMEVLLNANAIKDDYEIICDSSINTAEIEADKGMVAIIIWTGVKALEKIKVISYMKDTQVVVTF